MQPVVRGDPLRCQHPRIGSCLATAQHHHYHGQAHYQRCATTLELGNLDVWRDFSDVRAVAQAYRRLLQHNTAGHTVNICSGQTHSLREVLAMAEHLSGHRLQVQVNPAFVRANEVKNLSGNPARLRALIGPDWHSPPLQDTLRWMLQP